MNQKTLQNLLILMIFILGGVTVYLFISSQRQPKWSSSQFESTETLTPAHIPLIETTNWKKYVNEKYNFEFKHPASYVVSDGVHYQNAYYPDAVEIKYENYTLAIFPNYSEGRLGIATAEDVEQHCLKIFVNTGNNYVCRVRAIVLPPIPFNIIYHFDFFGLKPYEDLNPEPPRFEYSYAPTLTNPENQTPFDFKYIIPGGIITTQNYDYTIISTFDHIISTFKFLE